MNEQHTKKVINMLDPAHAYKLHHNLYRLNLRAEINNLFFEIYRVMEEIQDALESDLNHGTNLQSARNIRLQDLP